MAWLILPRLHCLWFWHFKLELHAFGDASLKGYRACVYLKVVIEDGSCWSQLVMAKARVAPVKKVSISRLELLGAVMCVRLLVFVCEALDLSPDTYHRCWTDSMVVLGWIKSDSSQWKPFVQNRVMTIHQLSDPQLWDHCPGEDNPADLASRGVLAEVLVKKELWRKGPAFLLSGSSEIPSVSLSVSCLSQVLSDKCKSVDAGDCASKNLPAVPETERWGSFQKAIRVGARCRRFIQNARFPERKRKGDLSYEEVSSTKHCLMEHEQRLYFPRELVALKKGVPFPKDSPLNQLSPFMGDDGLIRVKCRLQFSDLTFGEKHPIILPKSHLSALLIQFIHVPLKHAGVSALLTTLRNEYWAFGARRLAKCVKRECLSCQQMDAQPCERLLAPLPDILAQRSPPFSVAGLDHTGDLFCSNQPGHKFHVLLIACSVTRAVHLELVNSLNASDVCLALRQMMSRRGIATIVYSDNAKAFRASPHMLKEHFCLHSPEWRYIAPRAPWWGGWWERLNKSIKSSLKRSLNIQSLTRTELETVLLEIEAVVNSRPLMFVGDDIESSTPLTPAHFLFGRYSFTPSAVAEDPVLSTQQEAAQRLTLRNQLIDVFWNVWYMEYLSNLPPGLKSGVHGNVIVGSVVLVQEDSCPRQQWPMGVIEQVYLGKHHPDCSGQNPLGFLCPTNSAHT